MAVSKQEVIFEFNAKTGDIDKSVVGLEDKIDKLADAITMMADQFGKVAEGASEADEAIGELGDTAEEASKSTEGVGKSAKQSGGMFTKMGKLGSAGFKAIGAAVAATGLGLLVQLAAMLIQKFTENKKVADGLKKVMAGVGAVLNVIVEAGTKLVDILVDAFTKPQGGLNWITTKVTELKDRFFEALSSPSEMFETLKEKVLGFGDTLKQYVIDKVTALIEGFGLLGKAVGAAFSGDFGEAADLAAEGLQKIYIEANPVADAVGVVGDVMEVVGEKVVDAAKHVATFVKEAVNAAGEATALEDAMQRLAEREGNLAVATARSAAVIEELKRQRDDERLLLEDRIRLAEEAAVMDQEIADANVAIQEEKARLLRQELKLQGETEERLQAVAEAEIAVADAKAASAGVQTELMTSIYGLNQEIIAQEQEMASLRRGWNTELLEGLDAERAAIEEQYQGELVSINALKLAEEELEQLREEAKMARDARLLAAEEVYRQEQIDGLQGYYDEANDIIEENAVLTREKELENLRLDHEARIAQAQELDQETLTLQEALRLAEQEINDRYDAEELARRQELAKKRLELTAGALGAIQALNDAFSKDDEKGAERAFKRNKALSLATATVNTGQAVVNALTAGGNPVKLATGAQFVEAGIAAATGAAQIATIAKSKYSPSGGGGGGGGDTAPVSAGGGADIGGAPQAPQLDLSFLGEGAGQTAPVQAYVIATDVSNAQQANQQIQDQATL
jgi:hypothetical protein